MELIRKEISDQRKDNEADTKPEVDTTEFETRRLYIDLYLEEAGWQLGAGFKF